MEIFHYEILSDLISHLEIASIPIQSILELWLRTITATELVQSYLV